MLGCRFFLRPIFVGLGIRGGGRGGCAVLRGRLSGQGDRNVGMGMVSWLGGSKGVAVLFFVCWISYRKGDGVTRVHFDV